MNPHADSVQQPSDSDIIKIAETLGKHEPGVSNYDSWGPLGYRLDEDGRYTIPVLPRNVLPFARALLARFARALNPAISHRAPTGQAMGEALKLAEEAIIAIEDWAGYASSHFKQKHGYETEMAGYRERLAALARFGTRPAAEPVGYVTNDEIPEHRRAQLLPGATVSAGAALYAAEPIQSGSAGEAELPSPYNIINGVWYYSAEQMRAALSRQAPAAPAEPEWIDDPHDIEQGMMRNPKWKPDPTPAEPQALLGWTRYEKARKLNPAQWAELHQRNLRGENFDDMIDALPATTMTQQEGWTYDKNGSGKWEPVQQDTASLLDGWARSHEFANVDEMNGAFMAVNRLRALARPTLAAQQDTKALPDEWFSAAMERYEPPQPAMQTPVAWVLRFDDPDPQFDIEFTQECPAGWVGRAEPLFEGPTVRNIELLHRAQKAEKRLAWLHSPASSNVDGWEWGIFRVRWGRCEGEHQIRHTFADFSDLDEAMRITQPAEKQAAPSGEDNHG